MIPPSLGGYALAGSYEVDRSVNIVVLDNAIAVNTDGEIVSFPDLASASAFLGKAIDAKRQKLNARKSGAVLGPLGLGPGQVREFLGVIASAAGISVEQLQEQLRTKLGFEPWQSFDSGADEPGV